MSLTCKVTHKPYTRTLIAKSKKDLKCHHCNKFLGISVYSCNAVYYCPSLKVAWCGNCYSKYVSINHARDANIKEHVDIKIDQLEYKEKVTNGGGSE